MPTPPPTPARELPGVRDLLLAEVDPPSLREAQTAAMDRRWEQAVEANPALFDGPTVVCAGVSWKDPETLRLAWYRATYRLFLLRRDPEHGLPVPSVFVSVAQPTDDGRLLVGRGASSTSHPGAWQLPGGTMEPTRTGVALDTECLRRHAARELVEEVGHVVASEALELWTVTRGHHGSVGVHFRAPARPADALTEQYARLVAAETAQGRTPELDRIAFIRSPAELGELGGTCVNVLPVLAARHAVGMSS
ncbi:NUDIX hydrolase [Streptomyces sp. HNS054]|uniref:NUDIX hydrolase n=1 Tax=Streptomyces sp. HNS054 TaxID=1662446 RepID=UPI000AB27197|nr:NUDIX domain-containing protein [Streptomyces sp. HNS054]WPW22212.1 NUDIX domain-containing protein [Streptomyces griseoincarnatus]